MRTKMTEEELKQVLAAYEANLVRQGRTGWNDALEVTFDEADITRAERTMAEGRIKTVEFDANRVARFRNGGELWQGTYPPTGDALARLGFDVVVLAAEEYQPPAEKFEDVVVIHAPNDDAPIQYGGDTALALRVSDKVARALHDGKKVLSTCAAGLNRSGLVSAFALLRVRPELSGKHVIEMIREARGPWACSNADFARAIMAMKMPKRYPTMPSAT